MDEARRARRLSTDSGELERALHTPRAARAQSPAANSAANGSAVPSADDSTGGERAPSDVPAHVQRALAAAGCAPYRPAVPAPPPSAARGGSGAPEAEEPIPGELFAPLLRLFAQRVGLSAQPSAGAETFVNPFAKRQQDAAEFLDYVLDSLVRFACIVCEPCSR